MALEGLRKRWGVASTFQVIIILIVFSVTGFSILYVKRPVFSLLHIPQDLTLWLRIPLVVAIYQVLLLFWGAVFGQFSFFWEKEKRLGRLLTGRRTKKTTRPADTSDADGDPPAAKN